MTDPAEDPTSFPFALTGGPDTISHPFTLTGQTDPFDSVAAGLILWSGTYSVTETVPPLWGLTSATCTDGSTPSAVDLSPGETVTCTFTDTLLAAPSLVLTKEISADTVSWYEHITVSVGADVYYRFAIQSTGNVPLTGTAVTDPDVDTSGCTFSDPLAAGHTTTCTVGPVAALEGLHTNTAAATADYGGETYESNEDSASYFAAAPSLALVKTVDRDLVRTGETVTFTLLVTNTGNTTITQLSLIDTYDPTYLTLTSWSVAPDGHDPAAGVITWTSALDTVLPLAPDRAVSLTIDFRAEASTAPGVTTNVAVAQGVDEHGYPAGPEEDRAEAQITEPGIAVLKTLVDPPGGVAVVDDTVTFTIHITNTGDTDIASLTVVDTYDPSYLTLTSHSEAPDGHDAATGTITWTSALDGYLPLAPDDAIVLTLDFHADTSTVPGATENVVVAQGVDEHGYPVDPQEGSDDVRITQPGIGLIKRLTEPPGGIAVVGDTVTFTIFITNTGDTTITQLSLVDAYDPSYLTLTSWSVVPDGHDAATGVITWTSALSTFLPLAPDQGFVVTIDLGTEASTVPDLTRNAATVQGQDEYGHPVGPDQGRDDVQITEPGITIVKERTDPPGGVAVVGDTVTFTIRITNTGDTDIASLTVVDTYDRSYLTLTSHSEAPDGHDAATGTITWTSALDGYLPLAPDEAIVLTIDFHADASTVPGVTTDVAVVQGVDEYGHPAGPEEDDADVEITQPGIAVQKTLADPIGGVAVVGDTVTFTIRITNTGDTDIASLTVVDTYDPSTLTLTSHSEAPDGHDAATGVITWTSALDGYLPLAPDEVIVLTIDFHTESPTAPGVTENSVTVQGVDEHGHPVGPEQDDDEVRITEPGIAIVKELVDPPGGVAVVGDTVTFTIHITNTGDTDIASLTVVDTYDPSYLALTSHSETPDGHDAATGTITWTSALDGYLPLAPDEGFVLTVDFLTVSSTVPGVTTNVAVVQGVDEYGHPAGPEEDDADVEITQPGIAVLKTLADPLGGVAVVSDTITFTIRITNTGDTTITSLTITDTYDSCMLMTSADPEPAFAGLRVFLPLVLGQSGGLPRAGRSTAVAGSIWPSPVVWHLADPLAPEASTVITVDFHAESTDPDCVNRVEVIGEDEHGHPAGPEDSEAEVRITEPGIAVLKTLVDPPGGVAVVGDTVTFTIRLTNTGDTTITQLSLVDTYDPSILTLTSHSQTPDGHDATTGVITWTSALSSFLPLAPDQSILVTIDFSADASTMPGVATNVVAGQGVDEYAHDVGPVEDDDDVRITDPSIAILKELTDPASGTVEAGETVTFTIRITNTGDTAISNLVLTDTYDPSHLTLTSWSVAPDGHDAATGVITWTDALDGYLPLAPDDAIVLTIDFRADEPTSGGVMTNTVTVRGQDEYGHPAEPKDGSAPIEIIPLDLVSVRLSWYWYPIDPGPPEEGKVYLYSQAVQQDLRVAGTLADDAQMVMILDDDEDRTWLETLETHSSDAQRWIYSEHDLMHYAGETIWLYFGVYNDGDPHDICAFSMYVDVVSLEACYGSRPRCVELVINGGFEVDEAWYFPVTAYPAGYSTALPYTGLRSMRVGIVDWSEDVESYSSGWQLVTIPEVWVP